MLCMKGLDLGWRDAKWQRLYSDTFTSGALCGRALERRFSACAESGHCKGEGFCSSTDAQTARQLVRFTSVVTQVCCFGAGEWEKLKTSDNLGENPVITGRNAALFVEETVFICLKNLGYTFVHLTQIWSLEGGHRMGENQF